MLPFSNFTNPFMDVASVPSIYRENPNLQRLFQTNGAYSRPDKDPVILWAIDILRKEYAVPLDVIEIGPSAAISQIDLYRNVADAIIFDDRFINTRGDLNVAFIVVSAIEPEKKFLGEELGGWLDHTQHLKALMRVSPSIRYTILTNGNDTVIYRRSLKQPNEMVEIDDLPKYQSAGVAAEQNLYTVALNPDELDISKSGLRILTKDNFLEVLGDIRSGSFLILRENEGLRSQEAIEAIVKYLFAKWHDEQATIDLVKRLNEKRSYVFSIGSQTDPERLIEQVNETFRQAKEWEKETFQKKYQGDPGTRLAFTDTEDLVYGPHTTRRIVENLQHWSLRRSPVDAKGSAFEDFLSQTQWDNLGLYITPTAVINLMVGILQPTINDFIGDPACGSARMLTHALNYVRRHEFERARRQNDDKADGINLEEPTEAFVQFRDNHLFGADISRSVMRVARVNSMMHGAQYADLRIMDSLAPLANITGALMEGPPGYPGFHLDGLSMILTNPPWGSKVTNLSILEDFASRDGVTRKKGAIIKSVAQEVLFVNRCLELLNPGGKLAIILPEGIFANSSMQYVRDWILRWARLKAVISLPQATFAPIRINVKTSVVFLEKRQIPLSPQNQLTQKISEVDDDYDIYMARIDDIGYDASGHITVKEEEIHEPPEVKEIIAQFAQKVGW
jgi:type I restriction enzyme M protein